MMVWFYATPVLYPLSLVPERFQVFLGLNPMTDGQTIRLPMPDLTEERRKDLAKLAGEYGEKGKIAVRNVRRDGMESLKADEKKKENEKNPC